VVKTGEDRSALERVLASELARSGDPGDSCPDAELLAAYFDRSLPRADYLELERHISTCRSCQEQLAVVARSDSGTPRRPESVWSLRTLVPLVSSAVAVIFVAWIAMRPEVRPASLPANARPAAPVTSTTDLVSGGGGGEATASRSAQLANEIASAPQKSNVGQAPLEEPGPSGAQAKRLDGSRYELRDNLGRRGAPNRQLGPSEYRQRQEANAAGAPTSSTAPPPPAPGRDEANKAVTQPLAASPPPPPAAPAAAAPPSGDASIAEESRPKTDQKVAPAAAAAERESLGMMIQAEPFVLRSPDARIRWRAGPGQGISVSRDGGVTWSMQIHTSGDTLITGAAPSATAAWFGGRAGVVWQTSDGVRWRRVPLPASEDVRSVVASDALHATVVTADNTTYVTVDGGQSWTGR
jgi:hypothetical protein